MSAEKKQKRDNSGGGEEDRKKAEEGTPPPSPFPYKLLSDLSFPTDKLQRPTTGKPLVVLVACGSFSPVTNMHLRMFDTARDYLMYEKKEFDVVGGYLSLVHDNYGKASLVAAHHRINMAELAVVSNPWVMVSRWETEQPDWSTTINVLRTYAQILKDNFPTRQIQVKLLCGADVLQASLNPAIWRPSDVREMFGKFGVVCLVRDGYNAERIVHDSDLLDEFRHNISIVPQFIENNISSTSLRRNIRRGYSIRYLTPDSVVDYINEQKLFHKDDKSKL